MKKALSLFLLFLLNVTGLQVFSQYRDYWPTNGWKIKTPEEVNINAPILQSMDQLIQSSMAYIDAFLIVKNGYLVYEQYYNGYSENELHLLCSATKSLTNVLMGILLTENYLDDIDQQVIGFFPEYVNVNKDSRMDQLRIEHTMSYTTGIDVSDSESLNQGDMVKYYLSCNFLYNPGEQFRYATPASQIQSAIISKLSGMKASDFAREKLFSKLGINKYSWPADAQGYTYGGYISYLCPRDMLKIGFLYLNKGSWDGQSIVDPEFVQNSTSIHSNGGKPHNEKYGYNWWITVNNGYAAYFAGGYGGQFIYVVPELDLVVAITCDTNQHREDARFLINNFVVPAITSLLPANDKIIISRPKFNIYPNVINTGFIINFEMEREMPLNLKIFDCSGKEMLTLFDKQRFSAGSHTIKIANELPTGSYFVKGTLGKNEIVSKLLVSGTTP